MFSALREQHKGRDGFLIARSVSFSVHQGRRRLWWGKPRHRSQGPGEWPLARDRQHQITGDAVGFGFSKSCLSISHFSKITVKV